LFRPKSEAVRDAMGMLNNIKSVICLGAIVLAELAECFSNAPSQEGLSGLDCGITGHPGEQ